MMFSRQLSLIDVESLRLSFVQAQVADSTVAL